jgi:hypothetical protein
MKLAAKEVGSKLRENRPSAMKAQPRLGEKLSLHTL